MSTRLIRWKAEKGRRIGEVRRLGFLGETEFAEIVYVSDRWPSAWALLHAGQRHDGFVLLSEAKNFAETLVPDLFLLVQAGKEQTA